MSTCVHTYTHFWGSGWIKTMIFWHCEATWARKRIYRSQVFQYIERKKGVLLVWCLFDLTYWLITIFYRRCFSPKWVFPQNSPSSVNCIINIHRIMNTLIIYLGFLPCVAKIQKRNTCLWKKRKIKKVGNCLTQNIFHCKWNKYLGEEILNISHQKGKFSCVKSNDCS